MIQVEGLHKTFDSRSGSIQALSAVTFAVNTGECLAIFGPSGSGKSTLLRCLAGLENPDQGIIRIGGVTVFDSTSRVCLAPWTRPIGFVFQDYALWPHLTVLENVMFPLRYGRQRGEDKTEVRARASAALVRVGLRESEQRFPPQLSGGEKQRVALARALVSEPSVLLMDEPLSSLDPHLRKNTRNELIEILERAKITTVLVSHDHVDGLFLAQEVGIMRRGRLIQVGPPASVMTHPRDASVAETLNLGAVLPCKSLPRDSQEQRFELDNSNQSVVLQDQHIPLGGQIFMLIPSDACRLLSPSAQSERTQKLVVVVVRESYVGRGWCTIVRLGKTLIDVREKLSHGLRPGDVVELELDVNRIRLLSGS